MDSPKIAIFIDTTLSASEFMGFHHRDNSYCELILFYKELSSLGFKIFWNPPPSMTCYEFLFVYNSHVDLLHYSYISSFLVVLETPFYAARIYNPSYWKSFHYIFSWNKDYFSTHKGFSFLPYSVLFSDDHFGISNRKQAIAAIFSSHQFDGINEGYLLRHQVISYFDDNKVDMSFHLYGMGWDSRLYPPALNRYNSLIRRKFPLIYRTLPKSSLPPNYKGKVQSKSTVLQRYCFSFCCENNFNMNDYVTEKIWDSLVSGCIPIYKGPPNVYDYFNDDIFINISRFDSLDNLFSYVVSLSEEEIATYQSNIASFVSGSSGGKFDHHNMLKLFLAKKHIQPKDSWRFL